MIQIRLYGEDHQQKLIELQQVYGARTLTKMLEQLIDAAHAKISNSESLGGSYDSSTSKQAA